MSIRQHIDLISEAFNEHSKPLRRVAGNWSDWARKPVKEDFGANKAPPFGKKDTDNGDDADERPWEAGSKDDVDEDIEDFPTHEPMVTGTFGSKRPHGTLQESKQRVLDNLDMLLGCQMCTKSEKIAALREVAATATRMASGIESHLRQSARGTEGY